MNAIFCFISDSAKIQPRPVFSHLEVADDLSFLVCADEANNIYLISLDVYFKDSPSQLVSAGFVGNLSSSIGNVKFQYEPDDEDAVARVSHMSGIIYGDRVWKTELLAFRSDAKKQGCLSSVSGYNYTSSLINFVVCVKFQTLSIITLTPSSSLNFLH